MAMKHTDEEIERAAEHYERLTKRVDPDVTKAEDLSDLRAVLTAADATCEDEARLREVVGVARAHGRSWNHIAVALGVSHQAARQRFSPGGVTKVR
jgi:DnaJ-domain-containing protein 1